MIQLNTVLLRQLAVGDFIIVYAQMFQLVDSTALGFYWFRLVSDVTAYELGVSNERYDEVSSVRYPTKSRSDCLFSVPQMRGWPEGQYWSTHDSSMYVRKVA